MELKLSKRVKLIQNHPIYITGKVKNAIRVKDLYSMPWKLSQAVKWKFTSQIVADPMAAYEPEESLQGKSAARKPH